MVGGRSPVCGLAISKVNINCLCVPSLGIAMVNPAIQLAAIVFVGHICVVPLVDPVEAELKLVVGKLSGHCSIFCLAESVAFIAP